MSWGVFLNERTGLSSLLDPLLESSSLSLSHLQLTVSQSVRLGLESLLVCVCVSAVSLSRLCSVCVLGWVWAELLCNWQLVTHSVLASSLSMTPDQILTEIRKLRDWCHGASSLTEDGSVFFTLPSLESPLHDPILESSSLSHSELLPSLGQLSLCPDCVLFSLSSVLSGSVLWVLGEGA
jgi:hypothetical protein